ncbi:hypothetical protein OG444_40345 (plasmid) [Streptomyces sp. NBC_01232]|uniref:hypothetical protein n=1 Tax=Streptomyces sp. NBC_01232 TaxID=2903786 RepID=UPI00069BF4D5|nr:hypothetical protein [Streptomyces sp. NBC_01232]WSQ03904.1 hypothetical protein OG444_40345 [Streptomyces sp. NBC_01232]
MPFDWTGIPPAMGAVAALAAPLMKLWRDRRSRTAVPEPPQEDVAAVVPAAAGRVPVMVHVEVSGPSRVRVTVADGRGLILVDTAVDPDADRSWPSPKERAPW